MTEEYKSLKQRELMGKKHKEVFMVLNGIDKSAILVFAGTGCVSISVFTSLIGIDVGITNASIELKCEAEIKKFKKKKKSTTK